MLHRNLLLPCDSLPRHTPVPSKKAPSLAPQKEITILKMHPTDSETDSDEEEQHFGPAMNTRSKSRPSHGATSSIGAYEKGYNKTNNQLPLPVRLPPSLYINSADQEVHMSGQLMTDSYTLDSEQLCQVNLVTRDPLDQQDDSPRIQAQPNSQDPPSHQLNPLAPIWTPTTQMIQNPATPSGCDDLPFPTITNMCQPLLVKSQPISGREKIVCAEPQQTSRIPFHPSSVCVTPGKSWLPV